MKMPCYALLLPVLGWAGCAGHRTAVQEKSKPQSVQAEILTDRVRVFVQGKLFTDYLFTGDSKYPYFFPVNGPASDSTVTVQRRDPYPHHSSIFFGCDRVNDGNYWQEDLTRGRIAGRSVRVLQRSNREIEIRQECVWERPGADSPFDDSRRIMVSAPSAFRRLIDFNITLTARIDVRIEKTNHSLFSARVAPDLSVRGGGRLLNSEGGEGIENTFGKPAAWADYRGRRGSIIEGVTIFSHPQNPWSPPPWFTRDYGFFSPTPMEWLDRPLDIPKGRSLRLRYLVLVHGDDPPSEELDRLYRGWSRQ